MIDWIEIALCLFVMVMVLGYLVNEIKLSLKNPHYGAKVTLIKDRATARDNVINLTARRK